VKRGGTNKGGVGSPSWVYVPWMKKRMLKNAWKSKNSTRAKKRSLIVQAFPEKRGGPILARLLKTAPQLIR